jgi:predicted small secreted protein
MRPRGTPPLSKPVPENPMKRLMAVAMLALFSIATLSACNTMEGLGKDVKKLGEKVEDKASS